MQIKTSLTAVAAAAMTMLVAPAFAQQAGDTNRLCSFGNLSGVGVTDCAGFYSGNLLKGDTGDTVDGPVAAALALLGMANSATATYIEKIGSLGGSTTVDFATLLSGPTIVGIHFGQGSTAFDGLPAYDGRGGGTAFYKFDAGTSLETFGLTISASSGAAIFQTTPVPEPGTYAMMLAGLGVLGFAAKRRKQA